MTQELSTTPQVDPRTLLVDANVRHSTSADKDLVASVREVGVLQPIIAVRTAQGQVRVRYGHRRTLAAIQADLPTVPVLLVADEGTGDSDQVERLVTQWAENQHRVGLSNAEQADVIGQLAAFGVSAAQIAKRTKTPRATVNAALTVMGSELARHAAARYDWLDQAAVVAEVEDDPEAVKALIAAAKTGQFDHVAQRIRDTRADKARLQARTEELTAQGITVVDRPSYGAVTAPLRSLVRLGRTRHRRRAAPAMPRPRGVPHRGSRMDPAVRGAESARRMDLGGRGGRGRRTRRPGGWTLMSVRLD